METNERYQEWLAGVNCLLKGKKKKIKQVDVAKAIDMTPVHLNAILGGRRGCGDKTQDAISRALGLSHDAVRTLGKLLLKGRAPEQVVLIAGIFRANKAASQFTPEEQAAVEECLLPDWREGMARWQNMLDAQMAEMGKAWAERFRQPVPPKPRDDYDVIMDSYLLKVKEWWRTENGGDAAAAFAFISALNGAFDEFAAWQKRQPIIKNPEKRGDPTELIETA